MTKRITLILIALIILVMPQVMAQDDALFVTITRVDSDRYPLVTTYVTVVDNNGLPLPNLTATEFRMLEDGALAEANDLQVEADDSSDLRLVVALDTSMPAAEVNAMKEGLLAFVEGLRPNDEMALMSFQDTLSPISEFTNDKAQLATIINRIEPDGNFTLLHEAVYEATNKAAETPIGRRAVIVVTNSGNNINSLYTAEEVITNARDQKVPLYIIGLQNLNRLTDFQGVASQTGGQSYDLTSGSQVDTTLQEIEERLRPGYRVSYTTAMPGDNQEHSLDVGIQIEGQTGQSGDGSGGGAISGQGQQLFVAPITDLQITLPNLSEGQTVVGTVELTAEVFPLAEGTTVEYFLGEQSLGQSSTSPFKVAWPTSQTDPGEYTLTAKAINQVGNTGETSLKLTVPRQLAVSVETDPRGKATIGDKVIIKAQAISLADIKLVEFFMADKRLGQANKSPYEITLNTQNFEAGVYTITATATDNNEAVGQASTTLTLEGGASKVEAVAATSSLSLWQRFLRFIRAPYSLWYWLCCWILLLLMLTLFFVVSLARVQRTKGQRLCHVEVTNMGNTSSRYEIRAANADDELKFQFMLNQTRLTERQVTSGSTGTTGIYSNPNAGTRATTASSGAAPAYSAAGGAPSVPGSGFASQAMADPKSAIKKAGAFAKMGALIADVLYAVSYMLPSALSSPVRSLANTLRRADMAARRIDRSQQKLEKLQGETGVSIGGGQQPMPPSAGAGGAPPPPPSGGGGMSMPQVGGGGWGEKVKKLSGFGKMAGPIGDVLFSISYILPTFLASPLRSAANTMRRADMAARRVDKTQKQFDKMQGQADKTMGQASGYMEQAGMAGNEAAPMGQPAPGGGTMSATQGAPTATSTGYAAPSRPAEPVAPVHAHSLTSDAPIENWAETPYIGPGQSLTVDLLIEALRPYRTHRYPFVVTARSVEQEASPIINEPGHIKLPNVMAPHRIILPIGLFVVTILGSMFAITAVLMMLGILV